ncbi:MAG: citrate/2-methylcitrate synthase [Xanthobacteraceae bacterium]
MSDPHQRLVASYRLIAKMPTIAAMAYKYVIGQPFIYPKNDSTTPRISAHVLRGAVRGLFIVNQILARAMDCIFILHADREQNASTSTVRLPARPPPIRSPASPPASPACGVRPWRRQ